MHKNYFFWMHLIRDTHQKILGRKIKEVYTQHKDELILRFFDVDDQSINSLKISILPGSECMLPESSSPSKTNSVKLFDPLNNEIINGVEMIPGKRVIKIAFNNGKKAVWIKPFSRHANIVYKENEQITSFKQREQIQPWLEEGYDVGQIIDQNIVSLSANTRFKEAISKCQVLNKKVYQEAVFLFEKQKNDPFSGILTSLLKSAWQNPVYRIYYDNHYQAMLSLIPMQSLGKQPYKEYEDASEACRAFLYYFRYRGQIEKQKNKALEQTKREKEQLIKMLSSIESLDYDEAKKAGFKHKADLIKANIYRLKKGMIQVEVEDIFNPDLKKIVILLNKNLSPDENAHHYYEKIKNFENNKKILEHRIKNLKKKIFEKERFILSLNNETDFRKINKLLTNKADKKNSRGRGPEKQNLSGIRKYEHPEGWQILVGKDDQINDQLTFNIARNKDIWLHAQGVPGSHVVIFNREKNREVPKAIIKEAAQYAAHFSKAKNAGTVPVIYTEVRYVRKPKGAKPGTVTCQREKTVFVKPAPMP